MRLPRVRFTIRILFLAIGVVAIPIAFFRPEPRSEMRSDEQAVEVAAALVMQEDATFRPDKHGAKVYRECGMTPLLVDFSSNTGIYVVKRLGITDQGVVRGPSTFAESDRVKSFRDGPGVYLLDRTGKVVALAQYLIGPDGEVAGVGSIGPVPQPSP